MHKASRACYEAALHLQSVLRGVIMKKAMDMSVKELARYIDYSVLKPEFTEEEIKYNFLLVLIMSVKAVPHRQLI